MRAGGCAGTLTALLVGIVGAILPATSRAEKTTPIMDLQACVREQTRPAETVAFIGLSMMVSVDALADARDEGLKKALDAQRSAMLSNARAVLARLATQDCHKAFKAVADTRPVEEAFGDLFEEVFAYGIGASNVQAAELYLNAMMSELIRNLDPAVIKAALQPVQAGGTGAQPMEAHP